MNTHICGNVNAPVIDERYYFPTPVGRGEYGFDGALDYDFSRNVANFFILKLRKAHPKTYNAPMLIKPTILDFASYSGPVVRPTGSEFKEQFIFAAIEKKQKDSLQRLADVGLFSPPIPDPEHLPLPLLYCFC